MIYLRENKTNMLETRDVILRKGSMEDWRDMYLNLWSHDESAKYMIWRPIHSEDAAKERMQKNVDYMMRNDFAWFIYEKLSGRAIGFAGMEKTDDMIYKDTGIAIGPAFTGKGYGKQVLMAMMEEAFENLGAAKFVVSCRSSNEASKRLVRVCGFCETYSESKTDPRTGEPYVLDYYEFTRK